MEKLYAVWLLSTLGVANRISPVLCEYFNSFEEIYKAKEKDYLECYPEMTQGTMIKLCNKSLDKANEIMSSCESNGIDIVTIYDVKYPTTLKNISNYPVLLFVKGTLPREKSLLLAVVGSRRPSIYGVKSAESISHNLANAGIVIVSGMARGIDTASHEGALRANGKTIAVLGCGIDIVYPPENKGIKELIEHNGAVLSEYPPGTPPLPAHFPTRNRIISGLSDAVLVVEGKATSGSRITADLAKSQGKEVFCLPGNIDNPLSAAPNQLIRENARLITSAADILVDMAIDDPVHIVESLYSDSAKRSAREERLNKLTAEQRKIASVLSETTPMHIDKISFETGMEIAMVNQCLFMLELDGIIKQLPGKQYILCI